jgi:UDP-N-acetylmuramyl pentapeptide phosphotransferase/UDP-N-acetylglucosamine-1-phosphate transferase
MSAALLLGLAALSGAFAALSIALALPLLRRVALAMPGARSSHKAPTPQMGGIFVLAAAFLVTICALALEGRGHAFAGLAPAFACALALCAVGAVDDMRRLPAGLRLALYVALAGAFVLAQGSEMRLAPALPFALEAALVTLAIVWAMNLTNFMDGVDGIVVAQFVPAFALVAALALAGASGVGEGALAAALAGALIGFFVFNRPRASLFLGDAGSVPLGFLGAALAWRVAHDVNLFAAIAPFLYFIADASLTLAGRALRGEAVWRAHRSHFYQRAFDAGQSNWSIIARVAVCACALAALAYVSQGTSPWTLAAFAALACVLVALLLRSLREGAPHVA